MSQPDDTRRAQQQALQWLLDFADFKSTENNYCWFCNADVNGKGGPVEPHEPTCIGVKAAALTAPSAAASSPPQTEPDALELLLTLRRIHMTARRALSFGKQATPQTPERMVERRDEFLKHIVGMCEDAGVDPPSPLRELGEAASSPQGKS